MIESFGDKDTQALFERRRVKRFESFQQSALSKLLVLHAAASLEDLKHQPSLRLETLHDKAWKGMYSIRINDQFRVCFRWDAPRACDVQIIDYH